MKWTIGLFAFIAAMTGCAAAPARGVVEAKTATDEATVRVTDAVRPGDHVTIVHHVCTTYGKPPPSCRGVGSFEGEVTSVTGDEARVRFGAGATVSEGDRVIRIDRVAER